MSETRTFGEAIVWTDEEKAEIGQLKAAHDLILKQVHSAVVGQEQVIREVIIALFGQGHALLMGVPGLAKTLLVSTLGRCLSLAFKRVQFTPDLMPSDITGTEVIEENKATGQREFRFIHGPIFTQLLLADEINRTPPKTQAALLEAMQERQVSVGGVRYELPKPFFVLATQNPIEQEGTYPLPEAQLDRFMFRVDVSYPSEDEEVEILNMTTATYEANIQPVLTGEQILHLQKMVRKVLISEELKRYVVRLVRMTRATEPEADERVRRWVAWGAGPRACQYLVIGAKAHAILNGRHEVQHEDIAFVARPVLGHRIVTNFTASAEGVDSRKIVEELLQKAG
ncbi:MAG: AAA family ATPase [Planctomycetes bacterium]|nr:AAA family ATPase [Planctomycetota bacterium]